MNKLALLAVLLLAGCPASDVPPTPVPVPEPKPPSIEQPAASVEVPTVTAEMTPALAEFLRRFDPIAEMGFVPTLRSGSTGIGYTLEEMMHIEENNSPRGDLMGMEIKAHRDDDAELNDSEKMNLFLKEPVWTDGLTSAERVTNYGYIDPNGRTALYSTVKINRNSHGFAFAVPEDRQRLVLMFKDREIASWTREILAKRLKEKHNECVFVAAHARGEKAAEEFHYFAVTWCHDPSVDHFFDLVTEGDVMLELRMHLRESGSTRNHGSAFRIRKSRIRDLYRVTRQMRP